MGLELHFSTLSTDFKYAISRRATGILINAMKDKFPFELRTHEDLVFVAWINYQKHFDVRCEDILSTVHMELNSLHQQTLACSWNNGLSVWLSATHTERGNFDLTAQ